MNFSDTLRKFSLVVPSAIFLACLIVSCGSPNNTRNTQNLTYSVGGFITGLNGTLVLQNNGRETLTVSRNGAFTISTGLASGTTYNVTVSSQPSVQTCTITHGSGTISSANATNLQVACTDNTYTISGTVSNLLSGTLVIRNNGTDDLNITTSGPFTFNTAIAHGAAFNVTVSSQPSQHVCTVTDGSGAINAASVTGVQVSCVWDDTAPAAHIAFPPAISMTDGDTVLVHGTASDTHTIAEVRVNGFSVQTSDNYSHWEVLIPLTIGSNNITVETEDIASNIDSRAAEAVIKRDIYFKRNEYAALDSINNRLIIGESVFHDAIYTVDLQTKARAILSDNSIPNGINPFGMLRGMAIDIAHNRILVTDGNNHSAVVAVDLQSGARTILSDSVTPTVDNPFSDPGGIVIDSARNRALVADITRKAVIAVDLQTGARTILSDNNTPNASNPFSAPIRIALDDANNRALVIDQNRQAVFAVNLVTGSRTILSQPFDFPQDIIVDSANNRALITDATAAIFSVDLLTGARTTLSDNTTPSADNPFSDPKGIVLDSANNRAFIMDIGRNVVIAMDLSTGVRTVLYEDTTPDNSHPLTYPSDIVVDSMNNRVLVVDDDRDALVAVDPSTGARTVLSDNTTPDVVNPFINIGAGVAIDSVNNRALVLDGGRRGVIAVDLSSGARTILFTNSDPILPFSPTGVAVDSINNRALVVDVFNKAVIAVDLSTGVSTILSDNTTPDDRNPFSHIRSISIDGVNNRALVTDQANNAIIAVDLSTGARTILSDVFTNLTGGITVDNLRNRALVMDGSLGAVIAVDLSTGGRTIMSDYRTPDAANLIEAPGGIAVDSVHDRIYMTDSYVVGALFAVDPQSGARVILSK